VSMTGQTALLFIATLIRPVLGAGALSFAGEGRAGLFWSSAAFFALDAGRPRSSARKGGRASKFSIGGSRLGSFLFDGSAESFPAIVFCRNRTLLWQDKLVRRFHGLFDVKISDCRGKTFPGPAAFHGGCHQP